MTSATSPLTRWVGSEEVLPYGHPRLARAIACRRAVGAGDAMEVKVASSEAAGERAAREALAQIRTRGYAEPFRYGPERATLLGPAFDCLAHNVGAWTTEGL